MYKTITRQYTNEPVSKADIETMLRAGMAAPTAANKQPWHFVAVTNKEKLAELAGRRGMIKQAGGADMCVLVAICTTDCSRSIHPDGSNLRIGGVG